MNACFLSRVQIVRNIESIMSHSYELLMYVLEIVARMVHGCWHAVASEGASRRLLSVGAVGHLNASSNKVQAL